MKCQNEIVHYLTKHRFGCNNISKYFCIKCKEQKCSKCIRYKCSGCNKYIICYFCGYRNIKEDFYCKKCKPTIK